MRIQAIIKRCVAAALLLCVLLPAAMPAQAQRAGSSRVLFISSYSYAWPLVPQQLEGIQSVLDADVALTVRCMNTKEVNDAESLKLFYDSMVYLLDNTPPYDVIITGDDAALQFAVENREALFPDTPIVFEGVNDMEAALAAAEQPLVTGIVERIDYAANLELALRIRPDASRVVAILDDTVTGQGERTQFYAQAERYPELAFDEIDVSRLSREEFARALASLEEDTILLYLVATADAQGHAYSNAQVCRLITENAPVPCYRFLDAGIGDGLLGGYVVSHREAGATAAGIAIRILEGEPVKQIAVRTESPGEYLFDYAVMEKYGISRALIPTGASILNYQPTFWEENGRIVLRAVLATLAACALLVLALHMRSVRRINDLLTRKNEELADAIEAAEQANQAKTRFLSNVSHDLRTPVSAIVGIADLARRSSDDPTRVEDYLSRIEDASRILLGIINDVLDLSAIENEKIKLLREPFVLDDVLRELSSLYAIQCEDRGVRFAIDADRVSEKRLVGDPLRLTQILMNLISNACKFTPPGGSVWVTAEQLSRQDGQVRLQFTVADTGCGISPAAQERIFRPFEQEEHSTARTYGGSGLGLAITKKLVGLMQGSIRCESAKGQGATFTVVLPFACAAPAAAGRFRALRALVVEDDPALRAAAGDLLTSLGVVYNEVGKDQAVGMLNAARAEGRPYQICFIGWDVADVHGLELTRRVRRLFDVDALLVVVTAAEAIERVRTQAQAAGADFFGPRPLESALAEKSLEQAARRAREADENADDSCDFSGHRVLLAEDQDMSAELTLEILHLARLEVDRAENGEQALEMFSNAAPGTYDVILMDIQMPVMDGYETARAIRASGHPQAGTVPILALTANAFAESLAAALSAGMNDHIAKPADRKELFRLLARYIRAD